MNPFTTSTGGPAMDTTPAPTPRSPRRVWGLAAATVVAAVALDQISKNLAVSRLMDGPADPPGPFMFGLVANRGALMGFPVPVWALFMIAAVVAAVSVNTLRTTGSRRTILGHGLLVGGAAGNLVDRFQHRPHFPAHAVVDWIASASLPTFNLADVAIVAGLGLLATTASSTTPPATTAPTTTPGDQDRNP